MLPNLSDPLTKLPANKGGIPVRAEREQRARGGEERPRGAGCLGIERGTWTLRLYTRAVSSRRGNCVLKNQAHDSQHYHDWGFFSNFFFFFFFFTQGALGGERMRRHDSQNGVFKDVIMSVQRRVTIVIVSLLGFM